VAQWGVARSLQRQRCRCTNDGHNGEGREGMGSAAVTTWLFLAVIVFDDWLLAFALAEPFMGWSFESLIG